MRGGFNTLIFVVSVLLGLYLLNSSFLWVEIPDKIALVNNLIDAVAGAVLIFLGVGYVISRRHVYGRGYPY